MKELTEERVREIVREEIRRALKTREVVVNLHQHVPLITRDVVHELQKSGGLRRLIRRTIQRPEEP